MHAPSSCPNCGAHKKFITTTPEPGTKRVIAFCGKCGKVHGSSNDGKTELPEAVHHLHDFASSMASMLTQAAGIEVVANVFTEGIKAGVGLALSVPWSDKEAYWMEKYGVALDKRVLGLKQSIGKLEEMEKTASSGTNKDTCTKMLTQYRSEVAELEAEKDGISKVEKDN